MPNLPQVTVNGDLICNGSDADAWLAMSWSGTDYGTIVEKTVNVKGNLIVAGGSFGFIYNGTRLQRINIDGNVYVAPGAGIDVWNSSTNNIMSIEAQSSITAIIQLHLPVHPVLCGLSMRKQV
ncbi:MAG: hypothetical protein IPI74_03415 [Bacteroidales bacterium]|nr:hypothetical protein [Bacteroidales bacterium]